MGETEFGKFLTRLKAAEPKNFAQLNQQVVSMAYDAVYIMKAAMEATNSTDGEVFAKWMEANVQNVKRRINGPLRASPGNHFLIGPEAVVFINRPDVRREDGLPERNCQAPDDWLLKNKRPLLHGREVRFCCWCKAHGQRLLAVRCLR